MVLLWGRNGGSLEGHSLYLFWTLWKERNRKLCENTVQLDQTTKIFLYDYFVWNGFHRSIFMIGFVN